MWNPWNGWVDDDDFLDFVYPRNKNNCLFCFIRKKQIQVNMIPNGLQNRKKDITQFNHVSMREDFFLYKL